MTITLPPPTSIVNKELNEIIQSRGGLFMLQGDHSPFIIELFESIKSIFDRYVIYSEKQLYNDKPRKILYGFLNGSGLNALAYATPSNEDKQFDFIGINIGTIFTLLDTFGRILSHPDNFPEVGNVSLEKAERSHIPYLSTDVFTSKNPPCFPVCPVRSMFANNLAITALTFLFYHEITHLRNGHLEYIREKLSYLYWQEAINTEQNRIEPLIHQALEMDADCGAVMRTLNEAFTLMKLAISPRKKVDPNTLEAATFSYGDNKAATKTVLYSIYVMFRLFDFSEWDYFNQHKQSHPQPPVRMSWIVPTIYEIFLNLPIFKYDADEFIKDGIKICKEAESACGNIKNEPPDLRGLLSAVKNSSLRDEYLETVKEAWRSIRPHLEAHKRGGKLAE